MGNKNVANLPGGQASLNSLLYGSGSSSFQQRGGYSGGGSQNNNQGPGGGAGGNAGQPGGNNQGTGGGSGGVGGNFGGADSNNAMARKKRRRKRSKNNRQRIKSFLSSSSGNEDQMNESMIESCSSPDYAQQEMELGKDFFFNNADLQTPQSPTAAPTATANLNNPANNATDQQPSDQQ